jgi:hypothetical protein
MRPFKVKNILELFWVKEGQLKILHGGAEAGIPQIHTLIRSAARTTT